MNNLFSAQTRLAGPGPIPLAPVRTKVRTLLDQSASLVIRFLHRDRIAWKRSLKIKRTTLRRRTIQFEITVYQKT